MGSPRRDAGCRFEVDGAHSYFVAAHGLRAPPVLVHNASHFQCGITNRGGRFADLDAARGFNEVAHHMPQNAYNKQIGLPRSNGPAIGLTLDDHALTRTFRGRGVVSMREDAGAALNARQRLAKDILDLRPLFGRKYNRGALEAIEYAKTLKEFAK